MQMSTKRACEYRICIIFSLFVNVSPFIYMELGGKCDEVSKFCLEADNGAKTTCTSVESEGDCDCFHFDQDLIDIDNGPEKKKTCEIIEGGYCSLEKFGISGRPFTACKVGTKCVQKNLIHLKDTAEPMGLCCPDNSTGTCREFLEKVALPKRGTLCDYQEYSSRFPPISKDGYLHVSKIFLQRYENLMLKKARKENPKYLDLTCFRPTLNAPKGSRPLFELRCNQKTNECDCGYSQVYESLTDGERSYYNSDGKWVTAEEPRGQRMVFDKKSGECRLPIGRNCTNFAGSRQTKKYFESCSSELKCCQKSYYDDQGSIRKDIIGFCAKKCPNFANSLKYSLTIAVIPFLITIAKILELYP